LPALAQAVLQVAERFEPFDDAASLLEGAVTGLLFLPQGASTRLDELPGKVVDEWEMTGLKVLQSSFELIQR
jgi:hypothetical protein